MSRNSDSAPKPLTSTSVRLLLRMLRRYVKNWRDPYITGPRITCAADHQQRSEDFRAGVQVGLNMAAADIQEFYEELQDGRILTQNDIPTKLRDFEVC